MSIVRSSSDPRRDMSGMHDLCPDTREPVFVTCNGEASLVVMGVERLDVGMDLRQRAFVREMRAYCGTMRGHEDAEADRLTPLAQVRKELRDA